MADAPRIVVEVTVDAPVEEAWKGFTDPEAVKGWNFASADWCCPAASSELREGGSFSYRMEARDGSMGFDFGGTFTQVRPPEALGYVLGDGRRVSVEFARQGRQTRVREAFDAEAVNPAERQRSGWQAILDNYKKYVEGNRPR
jgi:uncharacterized protein YndB with AHSA1/START domain